MLPFNCPWVILLVDPVGFCCCCCSLYNFLRSILETITAWLFKSSKISRGQHKLSVLLAIVLCPLVSSNCTQDFHSLEKSHDIFWLIKNSSLRDCFHIFFFNVCTATKNLHLKRCLCLILWHVHYHLLLQFFQLNLERQFWVMKSREMFQILKKKNLYN